MATAVLGAAPTKCSASSGASFAQCTVRIGASPVQLATVVVSNLDLGGRRGSGVGINTVVDAAVAQAMRYGDAEAAALVAANAQWWQRFWNRTFVSIPGDAALERFYYAHSYLIGSASRAGKPAAGLWGPWVHSDAPLWAGDFTLDYNFQANFWALYANNRLPQAEPQYTPLLEYAAKARVQAAWYRCTNKMSAGIGLVPCKGLHFPGHIGPWGFDGTLAGEPWASMSDHSNGVFAALNMVQAWEYEQNVTFLRRVAFPFCRDALAFYQGWMRRRPDGSWVNENDQANECNPAPPVTEARKHTTCYQNNTVFSNGFIRRVASSLIPMARRLGEPVDPQWAEIALRLDPLPTVNTSGSAHCRFDPPRPVVVLAGSYAPPTTGLPDCGAVRCGTRLCSNACTAAVAGDGMMDVMAWPVFPGEAVGLASPEPLLKSMRNTLELAAEWSQQNSFCSVFSQAARVQMPVELWVPAWREALAQATMLNGIVYQGGGGIEVAGALQAVADLMLQSIAVPGTGGRTYMALFPLDVGFSDLRFHRLRGKGAFVVSATWDATRHRLAGPVTVESEAGQRCELQLPEQDPRGALPPRVTAVGRSAPLPVVHEAPSRWSFATKPGVVYIVALHAS